MSMPGQGIDPRSKTSVVLEVIGQALERELDLLRYQANEIAGAGLESGDDLRFESMAARLKNAEAVRENLTAATDELERLAESSGEVVSRLRKLAVFDPEMADPMSAAEGLDAVAHDLLRDLRAALRHVHSKTRPPWRRSSSGSPLWAS